MFKGHSQCPTNNWREREIERERERENYLYIHIDFSGTVSALFLKVKWFV